MPVPLPVIIVTLPLADNSGRSGDIEGYAAVFHMDVGDGKEAIAKMFISNVQVCSDSYRRLIYESDDHLLVLVSQ
jgi:hypothetical protein